jgi:hypothetical protein
MVGVPERPHCQGDRVLSMNSILCNLWTVYLVPQGALRPCAGVSRFLSRVPSFFAFDTPDTCCEIGTSCLLSEA